MKRWLGMLALLGLCVNMFGGGAIENLEIYQNAAAGYWIYLCDTTV